MTFRPIALSALAVIAVTSVAGTLIPQLSAQQYEQYYDESTSMTYSIPYDTAQADVQLQQSGQFQTQFDPNAQNGNTNSDRIFVACMLSAAARRENEIVPAYRAFHQEMERIILERSQFRMQYWTIADDDDRRDEERDGEREFKSRIRDLERDFDDFVDDINSRFKDEKRQCERDRRNNRRNEDDNDKNSSRSSSSRSSAGFFQSSSWSSSSRNSWLR